MMDTWKGFKGEFGSHLDLHLENHHRTFLGYYDKIQKNHEINFKEFQRLLKIKSNNPVRTFFNGSYKIKGMIQINLNGSHFNIVDDPFILAYLKRRTNQRWLNLKSLNEKGGTEMKKTDLDKTREQNTKPKTEAKIKIGTGETKIDKIAPKPNGKKTVKKNVDTKPKTKDPKKDIKKDEPKTKTKPKKDSKKESKPKAKPKPKTKKDTKKDPKKIGPVDIAKKVNEDPKKFNVGMVEKLIPSYKFHLHKNQWIAAFFRHLEEKHHESYITLKPAKKEKKKGVDKDDKGTESQENGKPETGKTDDNPPSGKEAEVKPSKDS